MKKKIVVIGGGHGSATMLRGLKTIPEVSLTSVVAVSDSGGSTGRLRNLFDIPAIGDIRNVMTAMAQEETMFKFLMEYRFKQSAIKNEDVIGHNLGNLILYALMDRQGGNLTEAISAASKVLNVQGNIVPSSLESITLFARMVDGTIVKGEANIPTLQNQISEVYFEHEVRASHQAIQAIKEADLIVLGIGSLFTSILPNLIIKDIAKAINESKSPVVYYCNIMSETGETDSYCLEDHVEMIEKHGVKVDGVVRANDTIPNYLIDIYKKNNQQIVQKLSMKHSYKIIEKNLLIFDQNFVRHSPEKIKNTFMEVYKEMRE
ncbi:MAG TPA: YvcK family protein [Erysipelothrix sp.]|jgi:uncharacterized cofD-like protein|nr:YvcK family protein [Erysipelothrix sp.]